MPSVDFTAIPQSFRVNKISEDGGGYRLVLEMDEQQREQFKLLMDWNGKLVKFAASMDAE